MTLHLLKSFLHSKLPQMGLLLLFLLIFGGVAALYHLPAEPVLYSTLLCGVVALLFFSGQFHAFQRRHHTLQQIARQLTADLSAELPASASLLEQDISIWCPCCNSKYSSSLPNGPQSVARAWIITPPGCIKSKRRLLLCVCYCRKTIPPPMVCC